MFPDANCGESSASSGDVERHGKHRKTPLVQTAHAFSRQSSSVREYIERGAAAASSEVAFAARRRCAAGGGSGGGAGTGGGGRTMESASGSAPTCRSGSSGPAWISRRAIATSIAPRWRRSCLLERPAAMQRAP